MTPANGTPEVEIPTTSWLKVQLDLQMNDFPFWPYVHIDVDDGEFMISGELLLTFVHHEDAVKFTSTVAVVSATFDVYCEPAMVTTTFDTLQLQFKRANVVPGSKSVFVFNKGDTGILGGYASDAEFREAVDRYLADITSASETGFLGFVLPAYLKSRPMPDHWDHVLNMELAFKTFKYRTIQVHGFPISYLFIVFSVRGLDLPPPCDCETELASILEAKAIVAAIDPGPCQGRQKRAPPKHTDYARILAAAQIAAFGLSQRSFQEVVRPYATIGSSGSTSSGGTIYWSAKYFARTKLELAEILADGVRAVVDVTAQGTAKAAVRSKCKGDVLSASARLRIFVNDSSIKWSFHISEKRTSSAEPLELTIEAIPVAKIGEIHVTIDSVLIPPPLDQVASVISSAVANLARTELSKLATKDPRVRLIRTIENNDGIRLLFVNDDFFKGEAAVVLGQLLNTDWG